MRILRTIALAAFLLVTTACSGDDTSSAEPDDSTIVTIAQSRFGPRELEVDMGTTVSFVNRDAYDHTVTASPDSTLAFDSGALADAEQFTVEFADAGTYAYFCQIHPTMRATVVVR